MKHHVGVKTLFTHSCNWD